jgi:predicted RNase H-like nuclease (RuvC/YqgF family)
MFFQEKLILFVSFYEFTTHIIDIFSISFLSLSCREIRAENNTLTLKNLRRNNLITHRDSSVNQLEDRIFKSNKNLMLLEENLQKNANRRHIEMQACFCLKHLAHEISITRRQDIKTRQHLIQFESSSSFSSMNSSSFFSSTMSRSIDDSSNFVSTTFRRREVFEIREEKTTTLRNDVVTRVTEERKSRVELETKTKKSSIIRRCS